MTQCLSPIYPTLLITVRIDRISEKLRTLTEIIPPPPTYDDEQLCDGVFMTVIVNPPQVVQWVLICLVEQ